MGVVHGVGPRPSFGHYRYVGKQVPPVTSVVNSIAATSVIQSPSVGYRITLRPRQAIWIRRYLVTITGAASGIFAIGGEFEYQNSPFTLASGFIAYPLLEALSINGAAGTPFGQQLTSVGTVFCLIDDWYEYDDASIGGVIPLTIQLQSFWVCLNSTAAAINTTVAEQLTYDLYEGGLLD